MDQTGDGRQPVAWSGESGVKGGGGCREMINLLGCKSRGISRNGEEKIKDKGAG